MKPDLIPIARTGAELADIPAEVGARSYYALFLLATIYLFSSVDRTLISVLAEPIKREFGLSDGQLGLLTGIAFAVSYSIAGIPMGILVDRVRRTRLLAGLVAAWSVLTVLSGLATSAFTLTLARIGVGTCEAGASPAAMSIIADLFPGGRRGFAMALFYMSTPVSLGITFALGGWLGESFGWRSAFFLAGGPGLCLALLLLLTLREPQRGAFDAGDDGQAEAHTAEPDSAAVSLGKALRTFGAMPYLALIMAAAICVVVAQAGIGAFLSPFLIRVHALSVEQAGYLIGGVMAPTGIAGILIGGLLADRLSRTSQVNGLLVVACAMLLAGPLVAIAMLAPDWPFAVKMIGAFNFLNYTYYGATFATYISLAPVRMRGVLGGLFATAMTFGGYGFGPPLVGFASDLFAAEGFAEPIRPALVFIGSFYSIAGVLYLTAIRSIRKAHPGRQEATPLA